MYVEGVADDEGIGSVSGTFDESEVRITAYTSSATRIRAATPAVTTTCRWSCQSGSSSLATAETLSPALKQLLGPPRQRSLQERAEADAPDAERSERRGV